MLTRRKTLALGGAALAAAVLPAAAFANADDLIAEITGGAEMREGGVTLTAPEIAENGNTVPVEVEAPGAKRIIIIAVANPYPEVAQVSFGPLAAAQRASTRIRLAKTQDVIALAEMEDGSFARASKEVKVTIGGCGG